MDCKGGKKASIAGEKGETDGDHTLVRTKKKNKKEILKIPVNNTGETKGSPQKISERGELGENVRLRFALQKKCVGKGLGNEAEVLGMN